MRISKKIATAAAALALAAGLLAPTASAACPYTVGPLGRYIAPAEVRGLYAYGGRGESVALHAFFRRCQNIFCYAFPCIGGGSVQIFINLFWYSDRFCREF